MNNIQYPESWKILVFADKESNVPCEICGKLVKNKYILKQHVKTVHTNKKGAFCLQIFVFPLLLFL